jgi:hypothetical protein
MALFDIDKYYKILGLTESASVDDIKRAYRNRAKEIHPDKNGNPDAHEQFILLTEAYEYLLNLKSGAKHQHAYSYADWYEKKREQARQQASQYARMRYNDFTKTEYYKASSSLDIVVNHLMVFSGVAFLIALPIIAFAYDGWGGFIGSMLIWCITVPIGIVFLKTLPPFGLKIFVTSLADVIQTDIFSFLFITVLNIVTVLKIVLHTLAPLNIVFYIFSSAILATYLITKYIIKIRTGIRQQFISFCLIPLLINSFFVLNFVFSSNPTTEHYLYIMTREKTKSGSQETTLITLHHNEYSEYPGIRLFFDYDEMRHGNSIIYTFKEGLFGLRVLTDYEFEKEIR